MKKTAILLISCPDRMGINTTVTRFVSEHNGNILHLDQHVDQVENVFFMRIEWDLDGFSVPENEITAHLTPIALDFDMTYELHFSDTTQRIALFVSRFPHCLFDILSRVEACEWPNVDIPLVISNHDDLRTVAEKFDIPFYHLPITPDNKAEQEQRQLALLAENNIDLVILARYMQIVTPTLINQYKHRMINIHHSFLPAFPGAKPYHSAHSRGVKIIGATSHYVTEELDAGPIIEQDIIRVTHKDSIPELIRKGKDLEKIVLSRAVWWHLQHKILAYNNKTVILR
ncbi:MAG: formyltetrahydrofolate deformylase [Spartobacteria bacterium]|nr:formyltetrahydrofolate deformylase [Spartobacteria bacterium]